LPRSDIYGGDITQYLDRSGTSAFLRLTKDGVVPLNVAAAAGVLSVVAEGPPATLSYLALFALLAGFAAVLAPYVGVTRLTEAWASVVGMARLNEAWGSACAFFTKNPGQWGACGRATHDKLPTAADTAVADTEWDIVEDPLEITYSSLHPSEQFPPTLPQLRSTSSSAPQEQDQRSPLRGAEVGEGADDALQRARRLIEALGAATAATAVDSDNPRSAAGAGGGSGSGSGDGGGGGDGGGSAGRNSSATRACGGLSGSTPWQPAPQPVTMAFPPEPLGVPPAHTGYVVDCIMELQEPYDAVEVESALDGSTLLRM
jgi:uncharacterized membrane protein YgcG